MWRTMDFALGMTETGSFQECGSRSIDICTRSGTAKAMVVAALITLSLAGVVRAQDPLPTCGEWPFGNTWELALDQQRNLLFASSGGAVKLTRAGFSGLWPMARISLSKSRRARLSTSRWPSVIGSKDPAYRAR